MDNKSDFSRTVGSGLKAVLASGGRTYYVLEHKTDSKKFKAGDRQEIIIDLITLGRDTKCQVCFDDSFMTVSAQHATITKNGDNWLITHMGKNPTLINGKPIIKEWYLQNGDEIQLSYEGPVMGFIVPKNPMVNSLNLSKRLSIFRKQALKPYKQAIQVMALVFVMALGAAGYFMYNSQQQIDDLLAQNKTLYSQAEVFTGNIDSLNRVLEKEKKDRQGLEMEFVDLIDRVKKSEKSVESLTSIISSQTPAEINMDNLFGAVYFISVEKITLKYGNMQETLDEYKWTGTGFLMNDGRFVTARHVIEPWYFISEDDEIGIALNKIISLGGSIIADFNASSPNGTTLRFSSNQFTLTRKTDQKLVGTDEDGSPVTFNVATPNSEDWAFKKVDQNGIIKPMFALDSVLIQQQKLHILGYPLGFGAKNSSSISPIYGNGIVSSTQLQDGYILITDRNFDSGNSGGPAFFYCPAKHEYLAIGIISAKTGDNIGFIIPINMINQ
jgi:S1-C subfamily serine protease